MNSSVFRRIGILLILVTLLGIPVSAFEPLEEEREVVGWGDSTYNLVDTYSQTVNPRPVIRDEYFDWSPETGYYTGLWFDRNEDFINVEGLFGSLMIPFTTIIGSWFFIIIWGTLVMGLYLHTQDTTLPFVIGILLGSVISISAGADGITIMYLTMAFAGGGILAKLLLGRE